MIIVMRADATKEQLDDVVQGIKDLGYQAHVIFGSNCNVIGAVGDERHKHKLQSLEAFEGVEKVVPILKPFKLAGRELKKESSQVKINDKLTVGGKQVVIMSGPCSVESEEQIVNTAKVVAKLGAHVLRGGAFKPRTSPYSFQGLEEQGLKFLKTASEETGLPFITEIMNPRDIDVICKYADILQIGARNMQKFFFIEGNRRLPKAGISKARHEQHHQRISHVC